MLAALYQTKKELKASIGKRLKYQETSMFGKEFVETGQFAVVGPSPLNRKWYASVVMKDGVVVKVS